ncbi:MAG: DNA-3-methyladenine glycosylase family protein [Tuberibacillus sp.]
MKWIVEVPNDFKFETTVTGHGWYRLAPFHYDDHQKTLYKVEELENGKVVHLAIAESGDDAVTVSVNDGALSEAERAEVLQKVRWMLRLDENLQPFYEKCLKISEMAYVAHEKHGRLLRSSTIFEDIVKVMLTTNTTWNRTISMAATIVNRMGKPLENRPDLKAFPKPSAFVEKGESFLKEEIRLGYRSGYLYDLALKVTSGELDLNQWPDLPAEELLKEMKAIKGVGPYAQSTLLMILGSYSGLPVDSEFRKHVERKYFTGKKMTAKAVSALYSEWDNYKYLAYWFDRHP